MFIQLAPEGEVKLPSGLFMAPRQKLQPLFRADAEQTSSLCVEALFESVELLAEAAAQAGFEFVQPLRLRVQSLCGVLLA